VLTLQQVRGGLRRAEGSQGRGAGGGNRKGRRAEGDKREKEPGERGRRGTGKGWALAETLRLNTASNTTVASLNLDYNGLGEGGGRALAETLRLNTTLLLLNLYYNNLGEVGGGCWQRH